MSVPNPNAPPVLYSWGRAIRPQAPPPNPHRFPFFPCKGSGGGCNVKTG